MDIGNLMNRPFLNVWVNAKAPQRGEHLCEHLPKNFNFHVYYFREI